MIGRKCIGSRPPKPSSQHKRDLFAPEGQGRDKRQRQEIGDEGEGEGNKRKGTGVFVSEDNGLPLGRKETNMAHRQMAVCKGEKETLF